MSFLIRAYARYVEIEGDASRRLVLVGSGPLENLLRMQVADLRLEERVVFAGFREGTALAGTLKTALGLILVSAGEQWGLVVNEASALGVPVILSESPGARDVLVRNLVTGYILEQGSTEGLVRAMQLLGKDELAWNAMSDAATQRAWLGDAGRFVDSVELLFDPQAQPAGQRTAAYVTEINEFLGLRVIG